MVKTGNFYYTSEKKNKAPEHDMQCKLKDYMDQNYPGVLYMSSMVGVHLTVGQAVKCKKKGAIPIGFPDFYVFNGRGGYNGLVVELKAGKNKVKKGGAQEKALMMFNNYGYRVRAASELKYAIGAVEEYFKLPPNPSPGKRTKEEILDDAVDIVCNLVDKTKIDDIINILIKLKLKEGPKEEIINID